jgi:ABC-type dipeptide/oligopeptide/nickel transport system permease subunit
MNKRENVESSSSGIGLSGMLTVLFVGLKLTHYIDWSWWWVLSPTRLILLNFLFLALWAAGCELRDFLKKKRKEKEKRNAGEI